MDPQLVSALLGLAGGVLTSAITTITILYTRRSDDKSLESDEIRKRRVQIIYDLLGSRYVLSDNYEPAPNEVQVFNTAMSAFSVYFTNERSVAETYDRFLNSKTDDNLALMLRAAAKIANLEILDTQLRRVMTVPAKHFQIVLDPTKISPKANTGGGIN